MNYLILLTTLLSFQAYSKLTVETFNIGLAKGFVPLSVERQPEVINALKNSEADVLCLQEAWDIKLRNKIKKELSEKYQDIYLTNVYQTTTSSRPSCKVKQLFGKGKFVSCMQKECGDFDGDEFTNCILTKCDGALNTLKEENRECGSALMAKVGKNQIVSILHLINPFYRAGLYAYRGSNGLMLLSKLPLKDKKLIDFSDISTLNRRQALSATIEHNGEDIRVTCTHLAADLNAPYTGVSRNWADENYTQIVRLLDKSLVEDQKSILLGDFNCGHEDVDARLDAELPQSCDLLEQFYTSPIKKTKLCTYCSENSVNQVDNSKTNSLIDHVFLKGLTESSVKRVYDEKVEIEVDKGATIQSHLSDHFGVQVTID